MASSTPVPDFHVQQITEACNRLATLPRDVSLPDHAATIVRIRPYFMPEGWTIRQHEHSYYEGNIILEGSATTVGDPGRRLEPGNVFFHGPGVPHAWSTPDASCLRLIVCFTVSPLARPNPEMETAYCPELLYDVAQLVDVACVAAPGWRGLASARVAGIVARMLTLCELERPEGDSGGHREDFVRGVDEFLTDNYRHPIQLEDVARHMGVSMSGLIHQYRESAATTVGRRLLAIRMDRAAALLTDTGYTLTEIGDLAGIGDAAYLCRCFKRYFNMTPSEYRVSRQG